MKRRHFLRRLGGGALVAGSTLAAGCGPAPQADCKGRAAGDRFSAKWKMVTTWPKNFPGLGTGANTLARLITEMSGGRIQVHVYGAKELVPAFEVFDAVSQGTAQLGHGSAYYWKGKIEGAQFFSTVPFGLTADEMNAWLYHGGGMELWRETYRPFGLVPLAAGNTGVQMAGWFNREIHRLDDLKGLKMRIPGLGGEVLRRAGGTPVSLPGGELFTSLQSGAIDATEWVGPYNDLAFGLYKAAKYYYYPGWHEPGTTLECIVNRKAWESLPEDLRQIVAAAARAANQEILTEMIARNNQALQTLVQEHQVQLRKLPDDVLARLRELSQEVVAEIADKDALSRRVYESYLAFREQVMAWSRISEQAFLQARG
ncbi:MAG TPA: TRAP transporter substrate-binding protein [Gammaproteobacteria bacterium]|nr:TRAP transporter substrate-binding protein [Gammaproteobacteria bacterium]